MLGGGGVEASELIYSKCKGVVWDVINREKYNAIVIIQTAASQSSMEKLFKIRNPDQFLSTIRFFLYFYSPFGSTHNFFFYVPYSIWCGNTHFEL